MTATSKLTSAIDKSVNIVAFIPVLIWVFYPHLVARAEISSQSEGKTALVFEVKEQTSNQTSKTEIKETVPLLSYEEIVAADLGTQTKLAYKEGLRNYLASKGSPLPIV